MRKYINQQSIKQTNELDILQLIRENPKMTRKQIETATGLSWGAVSNITTRLLQEQYITEQRVTGNRSAGRTPSYLEVNPNDHFTIGLDINRTECTGVVVNLKNQVLKEIHRCLEWEHADILLSQIIAFAGDTLQLAEGKHILSTGIAMQGVVDAASGVSVTVPHCPDWQEVPLASLLQAQLHIPVYLEHDPNCLLYAWSQDADIEDAVLLRADKGIGMAVMLDGTIQNRAGMFEIGHMPVVRDGILCSCGRRGCLEAYASITGMTARSGLPWETLASMEHEILKEGASLLADSVSSAAMLLNVPSIVLCGRLWQDSPFFTETFCTAVASQEIPLDIDSMKKENAAYGAALIAIERSFE